MYGILSIPVKPGKYPALLRVPGAGVRPYSGDTYTATGKCIVLEIGFHGVPVTMGWCQFCPTYYGSGMV